VKSFFDSGPLPNWQQLRELLGKDIPWKLAENWDPGEGDWINDYVKNLFKRAKSEVSPPERVEVHAETRQDSKYVNVAIRLSSKVDLRGLQLLATSERLKISGLPGDRKRLVRFPSLVYPRSGKASMKNDRLLVVRFKRKPPEKSEYELFIEP